jgi:hypothetical protein
VRADPDEVVVRIGERELAHAPRLVLDGCDAGQREARAPALAQRGLVEVVVPRDQSGRADCGVRGIRIAHGQVGHPRHHEGVELVGAAEVDRHSVSPDEGITTVVRLRFEADLAIELRRPIEVGHRKDRRRRTPAPHTAHAPR